MMYSYEGLSPIQDPDKLRQDYMYTLSWMHAYLGPDSYPDPATSPAFMPEGPDGPAYFAAHLPPDEEWEEHGEVGRLLVVFRLIDNSGRGGHSGYAFALLHLGEKHGSVVGPGEEEAFYTTAFGNGELNDHDTELATKLREAVKLASDQGLFNQLEAASHYDRPDKEAYEAQAKRAQRAARALGKQQRRQLFGEIKKFLGTQDEQGGEQAA